MTISIQTIYLVSASIGVLAMIPQIRRVMVLKQSDGLSLTTWGTWACCQIVSLLYAASINARIYMIVHSMMIVLYWTMVVLIIKYRHRRSLLATLQYWARHDKTA